MNGPPPFTTGRLHSNWLPSSIASFAVYLLTSGSLCTVSTDTRRSWEWEFPREFLEPSHSPEMVHRELAEETGMAVEKIEEIGFVCSNTGFACRRAKAFFVQVKETSGRPMPEDGEAIGELIAVSPPRLWAMVGNGDVRDGFTLSTLRLTLAKRLIPPPI